MEDYDLQYNPGNLKAAMKGVSSGDLWKVPYERLTVRDGFNVRIHNKTFMAEVERLAALIEENGYNQDKPIGVFIDGDEIVIRDGHRRHMAVGMLRAKGVEIAELPCVSVPRGTDRIDLTVSLATSNEGVPLTPLEIAIIVKRLINYGVVEEEIAKRLGYSTSYVKNLLSLMEAPSELRQLVADERISAGTAIDLIKKHGPMALTAATSMLAEAEAQAEAKGQDPSTAKATKKHEVDSATKLERAAKNKGLEFYNIFKEMLEDPAYLKIDDKLRSRVRDAFDAIDKKVHG